MAKKKVYNMRSPSGPNGETSITRMSEYEKQRALRIQQNVSRMEELGLERQAREYKDLVGDKKKKKCGRKRSAEDDEYEPTVDDEQEGEEDFNPKVHKVTDVQVVINKRNPKALALAKAFKRRQHQLQTTSRTNRLKPVTYQLVG